MTPQNTLRKKILSNMQSILFWSTIKKDIQYSTLSIKQYSATNANVLSGYLDACFEVLHDKLERKLNTNYQKTLTPCTKN